MLPSPGVTQLAPIASMSHLTLSAFSFQFCAVRQKLNPCARFIFFACLVFVYFWGDFSEKREKDQQM